MQYQVPWRSKYRWIFLLRTFVGDYIGENDGEYVGDSIGEFIGENKKKPTKLIADSQNQLLTNYIFDCFINSISFLITNV